MERIDNSGEPKEARESLETTFLQDIPAVFESWIDDDEHAVSAENEYLRRHMPEIYDQLQRDGKLENDGTWRH